MNGDAGRSPRVMETEAMQSMLQGIWKEILGLPEVDIDRFFFDIGGTSFHALQAVNRIEQELGLFVPITILFEAPTIRLLAGSLRNLLVEVK